MRKRYVRFVAGFNHARERNVSEDEAIVLAVRSAPLSKKVRRSEEWCLKKGRAILRLIEKATPPYPL